MQVSHQQNGAIVAIVAHQHIIKENTRQEDMLKYGETIFSAPISEYILQKEEASQEIRDFILQYEWLGTWSVNPRWVFTARVHNVLACVVCLNLPNAYSSKILDKNTRDMECLIQRGASTSFCHPHIGSKIIRFACNWMVNNTSRRIFLGYADSQAGEIGIIYQACSFEFLGWSFGTKFMCVHPEFKGGKPFSPQSLRRTSLWKKMYKKWHGVPLPKEYLNPKNGFKNMSKVPPDVKREFYDYGAQIIAESQKIPVSAKGKYVLVLGKNKNEQRVLNAKKIYKPKPYPKR